MLEQQVSGNPSTRLDHGQTTPRWLVDAVIPTYNRPQDTARLLDDLAALELPAHASLRVRVVDNASDTPASNATPPRGLHIEHFRLPQNRGGSGGFNAGISLVLGQAGLDLNACLLWLLDSDARVEPGALAALLRVLDSRPDVVAAGSALADPHTGEVFEIGGFVCRRTGELRQFTPATAPPADASGAVEVEYVAACSMLVRAPAVLRAGLLADLFVNADDAEWCLRLARRAGGRIAAVPASRVRHPHPDRMRTWDRSYAARNAFALIEALRLGPRTRRRRAWREVARAACQVMVGRDDLAELHLLGLREALAGRVTGPGPAAARAFEPFLPWDRLAPTLAQAQVRRVDVLLGDDSAAARDRLAFEAGRAGLVCRTRPARGSASAVLRLLSGLPRGVAIVSARARSPDWLAARTVVTACPQGFAIRRLTPWGRMRALGSVLWRGGILAQRLAHRGPGATPTVEPVKVSEDSINPPSAQGAHGGQTAAPAHAPSLSIIILAFNRPDALRRTLTALRGDPVAAGAETVVVDNASATPLAAALSAEFPRVEFLRLAANAGVGGFEAGVRKSRGDIVLLLDDDAAPDPAGLRAALEALALDPGAAAATLSPRHPWTGSPEWPFLGEAPVPARLGPPPNAEPHSHPFHDHWPVMGCANLVRRDAWDRAGGYESAFFLYRNDTDLALKLLAVGSRVLADPSWVVWHDSPAAARKSPRWFRLATRNWVWMCRRHAPGPLGIAAALLGWAWAHRLAGLRPADHWRVLSGAGIGFGRRPPPLPAGLHHDPTWIRSLMRLRLKASPPKQSPRA